MPDVGSGSSTTDPFLPKRRPTSSLPPVTTEMLQPAIGCEGGKSGYGKNSAQYPPHTQKQSSLYQSQCDRRNRRSIVIRPTPALASFDTKAIGRNGHAARYL